MDTFCYSEITYKHSWDDFADAELAIDFIEIPLNIKVALTL